MYWDAYEHKRNIARTLRRLDRRLSSGRLEPGDEALVVIEQAVFWIAFVLRKLADSHKLSDEVEIRNWELGTHQKLPAAPPVDYLNCHRVDELYDLERSISCRMALRRICDLLVHSFVFLPLMTEDNSRLLGIYFNSDRTKDRSLYFLAWDEVREIVETVRSDDIVYMSLDRTTGRLVKSCTAPDHPLVDLRGQERATP